MPTTFANTINGNELLAKRAECDYAGNDLQTTYATKSDVTTGLASKQDVISDLNTIRSGASAGATAVQPGDLATVATTGAYSDLTGTPTIPTATSDLTNDSGFITLSDVPAQVNADWNAVSGAAEILNKPSIPSVDQTYDSTSSNAQSGIAMAGALANKQDTISDLATIRSGAAAGATALQDMDVSRVALTGSYTDLLNTPTIPSGTQLVPAATSADADKVLTVDSQGTPAWASAQAPISAGTGIDITNNVVSVDTSVVATQTDLADKEDAFDVGTGLELDTSGATPTLQVEAPVDIVAGPGIVIDNPDGNTLRVSQSYPTDETVLFEDLTADGTSVTSVVLSETSTNFEEIEITVGWKGGSTSISAPGRIIFKCKPDGIYYGFGGLVGCDNSSHFVLGGIGTSGTTLALKNVIDIYTANLTAITPQSFNNILRVYKVVGIHRINGGN